MAPKKNQKQTRKPQPSSSSSSSTAPRLQISAENENRLRRLLLNSAPHPPPSTAADDDTQTLTLTKSQKAKKLKSIYEKLSCEGFTNHHIELALSVLKDAATFESALDWLCLNLPSDELPLKFSTGASSFDKGGSVGVVVFQNSTTTATKDDEAEAAAEAEEEAVETQFLIKRRQLNDGGGGGLDSSFQKSQADWIKQYVQQQEEEEEESENWEDEYDFNCGARSNRIKQQPRSYDVIAQEYRAARLEAARAKEKGDKKQKEQAGIVIRELKQEMSALGLSYENLELEYNEEHGKISSDPASERGNEPFDCVGDNTPCDVGGDSVVALPSDGKLVDEDDVEEEDHSKEENLHVERDSAKGEGGDIELGGFFMEDVPSNEMLKAQKQEKIKRLSETKDSRKEEDPHVERDSAEGEGGDIELGGLFMEDEASNEKLASDILKAQKQEKIKRLSEEKKSLEKLDGIWKKGDPQKSPKAILHQMCQRSGWDAPKFNKVLGRGKSFSYTVSILRKASGRGKSRKAGGLVTFQLPDQNETFESAEDAQNKVAAYALFQLFPDTPVHLPITEPYASFVIKLMEGESSTKLEDSEEDHRSRFVDSLLLGNGSGETASVDVTDCKPPESFVRQDENKNSTHSSPQPFSQREIHMKEMESAELRKAQGNKMRSQRYQDMSKFRATLPIAALKGDILQLLKENDVLVVCGETGSGKTTQVPQFILDDMIESGLGGHCNIVCTQPRRIAAISVAERVADERCEPSPGLQGSLVGYQVRLDSAKNEKTKLLFCTTGILLRKLMGDRNLTGITHIIVDEVHERSLLGDFLLIVLKDLVEKRSTESSTKLKVILMSATVDATLFSRYFGHCPVVTAEGRTHPVTTSFLEDIYDQINYRLASDSPASLAYGGFPKRQNSQKGSVTNSRGKKNLVLSGWGDESLLSEESSNPYFVPSNYQSYSEQAQQNLKRLNEDVIDYDLLEDLICFIDETHGEGAILVFLPGVSEINNLYDKLVASYQFGGQSSDWVIPLHSSVASTEQKRVFLRPPGNIRKVVIATNIAETSITIDDVVYVIDCGRHKENRYNPQKKLSSMVEDWISQANARQRRGRAGRVKPGICFCLYTRHRFERLMRPYQVPEMLRMPLVELCLQIKLLSLGHIKPFLSEALEPPKNEAMDTAVSLLYEVGALEGDEVLTPLGHHLAKLPVDVLIGKMMLYGAIFGCLSPILSVSAFLSYKSPFIYPKDEKQNVERAKLALLNYKIDGSGDTNDMDRQSDHLLMMKAYEKWEKILNQKGTKAAQQFCNSYFLSSSVMLTIREMRVQFGTLLADIGLISLPKDYQKDGKKIAKLDSVLCDASQPFNIYSHHSSVLKAILCAGLYPNVAAGEQGIVAATLSSLKRSSSNAYSGRTLWFDGRREVHVHPSSINSNTKAFQYPFIVFLEKVETNKVFLRDTSVISPYSILLFGGSINVQHQTGLVAIDGWLKLTAPAQIAVLFKELRLRLHSILKELIRKPENAIVVNNEIIKSIINLLLEEGNVPK
ncbi:DExH-box ATP-dependent RNA helicase DExH7, chloroplastic-like [Lotus japonicus]|uniref:DExH-box ATP-dependent RNA helicase DExH7, chloroplastic-like n=1 Tax=Lotus japonicus TaxID=34305 RepID=UPI00258F047B|nr:DExH-box ATP-dependent RNA helicase DExH7, chloroplastic-like [Lotus japonicus]